MIASDDSLKREGFFLECATIAWCGVEAGLSIWSGIAAGSILLIGFGSDSAIEIFAGLVVIWQLCGAGEQRERRALRLIALTFFLLAAYVLAESIRDLTLRLEAKPSIVGIGVTAAACVIMPLLARGKRRVGRKLGNAVLMADSKESSFCALLSGCTLLGLLLNTTLNWWWADPATAIAVALLAAKEGWETWEKGRG
ncbi:MAG: cation transporter [Candidatus Omnitrophica bacterium]|nr:cation transporter [Candidatus Omnitrophota bacterium]